MIQFSFDVSVIFLLGLHQPIRSSASGAALANQKLSCWVPLLLEQLWPIRSLASGAALANQKFSCWVPLGTVTGFHTKPPIMPIFSGFRSVQFIIQRDKQLKDTAAPRPKRPEYFFQKFFQSPQNVLKALQIIISSLYTGAQICKQNLSKYLNFPPFF